MIFMHAIIAAAYFSIPVVPNSVNSFSLPSTYTVPQIVLTMMDHVHCEIFDKINVMFAMILQVTIIIDHSTCVCVLILLI